MIKARKEDKARYIRAIKWGHKHGHTFNGFYYDEELAGPGGMSYEILIPSGTKNQDIENAIRQMWDEQDVVGFTCVYIPREWIEEAISHAVPSPHGVMDHIITLREHDAGMSTLSQPPSRTLVWPDRTSTHIDPSTTKLLATVYEKCSHENRIKMRVKVNASHQDFLQVVDICWSLV